MYLLATAPSGVWSSSCMKCRASVGLVQTLGSRRSLKYSSVSEKPDGIYCQCFLIYSKIVFVLVDMRHICGVGLLFPL
jgi:hypothetical protein